MSASSASSDPAASEFSFNDDSDVSSPQRRSAVRKIRDSGASETAIKQGSQVKSFDQPVNSHAAKRRYARDVSYYYDDGELRLRDILRSLDSREGRLYRRQPIDRIDEPSEWRDRLRIMTPRLLTERHSLDRFYQSSPSRISPVLRRAAGSHNHSTVSHFQSSSMAERTADLKEDCLTEQFGSDNDCP